MNGVHSQTCTNTTQCSVVACCSQYGSCGYGPDFCGKGCQSQCDAKPECGQYADNQSECPLKVCCSQYGFCGTTTDFCSNGCQSNCDDPILDSCPSDSSLFKIGYYASWASTRICNAFNASNIDPHNYTHLNYAFGSIANGVMVDPVGDELANLKSFVSLRNLNPDLKVLISVGGWAFTDPGPTRYEFHNIISTPESRQTFIDSVLSYLQKYDLNGIDIDYEYPGAEDRGGSPEDTENYLSLVMEMRSVLVDNYLITIAAPASYWYLRHFKAGAMSEYLDWINVMTYDIHGVWDADIDSLGPYVKSHTDIREIKSAINLFLRDGVPSNKLVLGLGYYARAFTLENPSCNSIGCRFSGPSNAGPCTNAPGVLAWFEMVEIILNYSLTPTLDVDSMSKIAFWEDQWAAFDDEETLASKTQYAAESCFKGVMIWSVDMGVEKIDEKYYNSTFGSVRYTEIELSFFTYNDSTSFRVSSTRDSIDGFDYYSIYVSDSSPVSKRQTKPNQCTNDFIIITLCQFFIALLNRLSSTNDPLTRSITLTNTDDPLNQVIVRMLPNGYERVELVSAYYSAQHLNLNNRVNFPNSGLTSTNYMRSYLNALPDDERGHLVPNFMSGPPVWYNMVPQHRSVNRNFNSRWILNDWFSVEAMIREFFQRDLTEAENLHGQSTGNYYGNVQWNVAVTYPDQNTGRPSEFTYEAIFYDNTGRQLNSIFGTVRNCPPRDGLDENGKCVGL